MEVHMNDGDLFTIEGFYKKVPFWRFWNRKKELFQFVYHSEGNGGWTATEKRRGDMKIKNYRDQDIECCATCKHWHQTWETLECELDEEEGEHKTLSNRGAGICDCYEKEGE